MSASHATIVRPEVTERASAFTQFFGACFDGIARYFVCRAAVASLRELDDRALRDIGLERSHIEAAVYGLITLSDQASASSLGMSPRADGCPRVSSGEAAAWS